MTGDFDQSFETLRVARSEGIVRVTFDHPPINLLDAAMVDDLDRLSRACASEPGLRIVIFDSADPDFFIAHADIEGMIGRGDRHAERRERLSRFAEMTERFRTLPAVTLAIVEGRVRGGGSEFILALDLRYAAIETAIFAQSEVSLGLLSGGGATQRLPALAGRSRALEIMLSAWDYDAASAERLRLGHARTATGRAACVRRNSQLGASRASRIRPSPRSSRPSSCLTGSCTTAREEHRLFRRILATR